MTFYGDAEWGLDGVIDVSRMIARDLWILRMAHVVLIMKHPTDVQH